MVSKRTTWLGSDPWLMATHTRGYSCSGTTSISNTFKGLGSGKSKCCGMGERAPKHSGVSHGGSLSIFTLPQDTDLDEHEPLHGLVPLQQDDPRLKSSAQILVARVRVPHCSRQTGETRIPETPRKRGRVGKDGGWEGGARSPMQHL